MAEILGNKLCMESLQTDIQDVQWTINDMSSRVGPIDLSSWKFPDKLSWELDLEQLLDMYSFSEDEGEENQVAHIALYELLIDRLVLLVQGTAVYVNQIHQLGKGGSVASPSSTSVGLAVKHFWSQLTSLQTLMQQLHSQNKASVKKLADLEKELKKASSINSLNTASTLTVDGTPDSPNSSSMGVPSLAKDISCDESNKGSQTIETAFVPCESCEVVQKKMRESGDLIIDVCQKQGLPSCLRKYRPQLSHVRWLSYNDVSRWMAEQNKDVHRLCKHIEQMEATINPLKAEVTAFENETKQAESKARRCEKELQLERETQSAVKKQFENKLQEKEKQHELTLADLHRQKEELMRKHTNLATELDQRKTQTTELECKLQEWESKSQQLENDLAEKSALASRLEGSDREATQLRQQLEDTKVQLETTNKHLAKEQGKNRSAAQHKQQVQAKQESLSERVAELNQENEELRDQVNDLEEEKQGLQETLQETKQLTQELEKEKKEQEIIIRNLKEEKSVLEQSIQETEAQIQEMEGKLQEAKERERLIIEYPDLNGPVNPDLQGTGDIALDMENQVKANLLRIHVLEEQNEGLTRSISKVVSLGRSGNAAKQPPKTTAPVPLWQTNSLEQARMEQDPPVYRPAVHKPPTPTHTTKPKPPSTPAKPGSTKAAAEFFTVGKASRENTRETKKPPAGRGGGAGGGGFIPVNATSIGAYKQIKRAMGETRAEVSSHLKSQRPVSGRFTAEASSHGERGGGDQFDMPTYVCEHCDKMYTKARDLEIHRSYCTP